ncbi:hypothetical protein Btus_2888 [Kyrpidia tusciae DSM 2912]|uniref:Uncharacterized protein n=1 Tax=Kyrpidia tusciae (strain DSM 2912 / NBRC 15312 / T2) TaxID=562970 RepID=D5WV53_KYRT2|nr:hypothetical protein Btus_2888 [Kyrpidia tusciae DSM 2912]
MRHEQSNRHIAVLKDLFESIQSLPVPPLGNVIAFPHPEVVIKGVKPTGAYLVRMDRLRDFIDRTRSLKPYTATLQSSLARGNFLLYNFRG